MVAETNRLARDFRRTRGADPGLSSTPTSRASRNRPIRRIAKAERARRNWCRNWPGWPTAAQATLLRKDCINGFVDGDLAEDDGGNAVADWINGHGLDRVLVVGICTDICVMDFVLTLLVGAQPRHDAEPEGHRGL